MKRTIDKIADISHPSLDILKSYFENLEFNYNDFPELHNITLYKKKGVEKIKGNVVQDLNETTIASIVPNTIIKEIYNFVEYLKSIYNLDIIWLMLYTPNTHLSFHIDDNSNRHLINVFDHERFFNYECAENNASNCEMYTQKMKDSISNIDEFNEFFINFNPTKNSIKVIESNAIYVFNSSIHTFFNGSDKLRVNFVFETEDGRKKESDLIEIDPPLPTKNPRNLL